MLYIEIHPKLKPFLLNLEKNYALINPRYQRYLKSGKAVTLYRFLKSHAFKRRVICSVDALKELFSANPHYDYNLFKKRFIIRYQENINAVTDLSFSFKDIKQ